MTQIFFFISTCSVTDSSRVFLGYDVTFNTLYTQAISQRMVFVLRYPLLDNLPAMPDIMESRPNREMWKPTSPIALFAVNPRSRDNLVPIAIQMDIKPGMKAVLLLEALL